MQSVQHTYSADRAAPAQHFTRKPLVVSRIWRGKQNFPGTKCVEKTVFSALFYYEKKTPVDHFRVGGQGGKLINRRKGGGNGSKRWSAPLSVSLTNSNLVITFVDEIYYETYRMWKSGTCFGNSKGIGNTCPLRHYYLPRFEECCFFVVNGCDQGCSCSASTTRNAFGWDLLFTAIQSSEGGGKVSSSSICWSLSN